MENADPDTDEARLTWHRAITMIWPFAQFVTLFGILWYVTGPGDADLNALETIVLSTAE